MRRFVRSMTGTQNIFLKLLAAIAMLSGCASSNLFSPPPPPPVVGISLNLTTVSVQVSQTKQFTATVTNSANTAVTWQVNGTAGGDSTHGTIDANGLFTAPATVPNPAAVTVTAIAQADTAKTASAQVTITTTPVISVSVAPGTASVQTNQTHTFTATVTNDSQNQGVNWSLSGAGCSGVACGTLSTTSSMSGVAITYTAPAAVPAPAAVTITATSVTDGAKSGAATITVTAPPAISVTVAPTTANVQAPTGTKTFTATVTNDSQNQGVTWSLSGAGCAGATCGSLSATASASGAAITYTAPTNVPSPSAVTLKATAVSDTSKSATTAITVTAPPAISVAVAPLTASVQAAVGTKTFTATVTNDAQGQGVTWALSGTGCAGATCGTLSSTSSASGVAITYTAPVTVPSPAAVTLTATSVTDTSKSGAATITVTAPPAITVTVAPTPTSVQAGIGTKAFTATVTNDSQNQGVNWALSGAGCSGLTCGTLSATSSASGAAITYTAPANVPAPATVILTATSVSDGTKSGTATITVTAPVGVSIVPNATSVQTSQPQNFTATVANDTQNKGVSWTLTGTGCSGATCGTLSTTTSASGVAITYTAPASVPSPAVVTLTATSVADSARNATATITVTAAPVIVVSVAPSAQSVQAGIGTHAFTATVTNDSQNKGVSWALSGAGCSGVTCGSLSTTTSASGTPITYTAPANAPSPATVTLTATSVADGSKLGTATITVTAGVSVSVAPSTANVQAKIGTKAFTATVSNDTQNKGVTWALSGAGCSGATCGTLSASSSASGVAITYTAPATVPSPATVTLTATSVADGTKTSAATITVTAAVAVSVAPSAPSVQVGQTQGITATVSNDGANQGVTWVLSGAGCSGATCGTISSNSSASGVAITYTAPVAVPSPATVTLTGTSVTDTSKSAAATITVTPSAGGTISVTLTPIRGGMTVTGSQIFTATVTNDVGNAGVTWTNSAGTFSASSTTSATYVAPSTPGSITVTATSVADGAKSATATIGVTDLTGVTTYHNNLSRDGANTQEYALTTANVKPSTFGKLFSCTVDGAIYAQPLWAANITIGGIKHNVVLVATQHDSVYLFDADANPCTTYWNKTMLDAAHGAGTGETSVPSGLAPNNLVGYGFADVASEVGITGTPVIDLSTNTVYLVSKSVKSGTTFYQRLHALDLVTGNEKFGGPVTISASSPGTGDQSTGGVVPFNPQTAFQRPGLALVNGVVYVGFASHEDKTPYHGWLLGYDAATLAQTAVYNVSPNSGYGGIWMGGGAPSADASNNLYLITGNGTYNGDGTTNSDYGDTFLKLSTSSGLSVADWFTPADESTLNINDTDFGSGGAAILVDQPIGAPHQQLVIGGGKQGNLFLLDRTNMKHKNNPNQVVQTLAFGNGIFATAAFWNNNLYLAGTGTLKQFVFNPTSGLFATSPASTSTTSYGFPGATPSVSAQGTSNGIIWATASNNFGLNSSNPGRSASAAVLHAYDATSLTTDLWNSSQASGGRDTAGFCVKFTVPTVANGRVYVGTRGDDSTQNTPTKKGELDVYGLLPN